MKPLALVVALVLALMGAGTAGLAAGVADAPACPATCLPDGSCPDDENQKQPPCADTAGCALACGAAPALPLEGRARDVQADFVLSPCLGDESGPMVRAAPPFRPPRRSLST